MKFLEQFKRITTTGTFFAEIDGLRFIAIKTVVLFHTTTTVNYKILDSNNSFNLLTIIYKNGWQGVELFFVISGFIIGLPFGRHYLQGGKKINLKNYFMRRLTRLEPPYFISLIVFLIVLLLTNQISLLDGIKSLSASMIYMNNIIFNNPNYLITSVIWSLEIEVQFYILAVFFAKIFGLGKAYRRLLFVIIIIGMPVLHLLYFPTMPTIYLFLHFFFMGFLLVDIYLDENKPVIPEVISIILGIVSLFGIFFINYKVSIISQYLFMLSIFIFYYIVLNNRFWKKIMSVNFISITGGMCYTIYLIHTPIISAFSKNFYLSENIRLLYT